MTISQWIPLDVEDVIRAIYYRQGLPWNNGRINDYSYFEVLQTLFFYMNSGIPKEDFFYQGDLYRVHSSYSTLISQIDKNKERVIGGICSDGSCRVLPITKYSNQLVSFSKNHDFTRSCYYKLPANRQAVILWCKTRDKYGLDVNTFLKQYNAQNKTFEAEEEVLFPLQKCYLKKEYHCSPTQFKYYLRSIHE